jgi:hypothetical protein
MSRQNYAVEKKRCFFALKETSPSQVPGVRTGTSGYVDPVAKSRKKKDFFI